MKWFWARLTLVLAALAFIVSVVTNIEKFVSIVGKYTVSGANLIAVGIVRIPYMRDSIARSAIKKTYDDEVCLIETKHALLNRASYRNGIIALFARRMGDDCTKVSNRTSAAIYAFSGTGYEFVDDISGYKFPGLDAENLGEFIIATVTETDFPESLIFVVRDNKIRSVKRVTGWADDKEGEEIAVLDYSFDGGCLSGVAAGEDLVNLCDSDVDKMGSNMAPNTLSFDEALSIDNAEECQENCSDHVEFLTRIVVPGRCLPDENLAEWNTFKYKFKVTMGDAPSDDRVARFVCSNAPDLVLSVDGRF